MTLLRVVLSALLVSGSRRPLKAASVTELCSPLPSQSIRRSANPMRARPSREWNDGRVLILGTTILDTALFPLTRSAVFADVQNVLDARAKDVATRLRGDAAGWTGKVSRRRCGESLRNDESRFGILKLHEEQF